MNYVEQARTWLFDCDGVLLDSNRLKTEAFYEVAVRYGQEVAEQLVYYHQEFGGISRFDKFNYFFDSILKRSPSKREIDRCLEQFSLLVKKKLFICPETYKVRTFLEKLPSQSIRYVISGGAQTELREIFKKRNLSKYFNEIYGSPYTKEIIVQNLIDANKLQFPVVLVGDSRYDYDVATQFHFNFIFMSGYTEFIDWRKHFRNNFHINIIDNFDNLL
jgi:phosphoglycolate phosphatase-like HAD superfamily hydrolase